LAVSKGLADVRGQRYLKLRPDRVAMQVRLAILLSVARNFLS
jgi:hypothetical protein